MSETRDKLIKAIHPLVNGCSESCEWWPTSRDSQTADAILAKFDVTEKQPRFYVGKSCGDIEPVIRRNRLADTETTVAHFFDGTGLARQCADFLNSKEPK